MDERRVVDVATGENAQSGETCAKRRVACGGKRASEPLYGSTPPGERPMKRERRVRVPAGGGDPLRSGRRAAHRSSELPHTQRDAWPSRKEARLRSGLSRRWASSGRWERSSGSWATMRFRNRRSRRSLPARERSTPTGESFPIFRQPQSRKPFAPSVRLRRKFGSPKRFRLALIGGPRFPRPG